MSQENVEVVTASWAAYARGDYETSLGAYAENTVWDDTQYRPDGAIHVGHRALVEVARTWRGTWNRWGVVVTVRDGKIVHTVAYRSQEAALKAAGLSE